jgi:histidinol-phosphate phosphatase family protein
MEYTVFLDRDGVINSDSPDYIKDASQFEFIPRSPEAIALLNQNGFSVIVVTNQSMIGRKLADQTALDGIFEKMIAGVKKAGGRIKDIFFCPHTPEADCPCRKPKPGMLLNAKKKYGLDLDRSCMVGDSVKDMESARAAGCGKAVLVETGNGANAARILLEKGRLPDCIASDLFDAALWLIRNVKN